MAAAAGPLDQQMLLMGATMSYPRNAEIFGENEAADYLYKVVSGSVRTYKILSDGRRQIGGFYMPGDIFGLEFGDEHALSAEAVTDAKVLVVKRSALNALAGRDASIAAQLFALIGRELRRAQDHVVLLIQSAQERVAGFLLEMAGAIAAERCDRAADVAAGHRRLSRSDDRDRIADVDLDGGCGGDRIGDVAAHRCAQPQRITSHERLKIGSPSRRSWPTLIRTEEIEPCKSKMS